MVANTEQELGGFWSWMRNSMIGRLIGVDDKSRADKQSAELVNAGQESGGFWSWMRNSMIGRLFGVDDKSRAEKQAAELANAGQESGGLWSWIRNSWLGRQFGLDDMSRIQKGAPMKDSVDIEAPTAMAQAPVREQSTVSRQRVAEAKGNNRPQSVARNDSSEEPKSQERKMTSKQEVSKNPLPLGSNRIAATNLGEEKDPITLNPSVNAPLTPLNVSGLPEQTDDVIGKTPLVLTIESAVGNAPKPPLEIGLTGKSDSNYNKLLDSITGGTNWKEAQTVNLNLPESRHGSLLKIFDSNSLNITSSGITISIGGQKNQDDITQTSLNPNLTNNMNNNR